MSDRRIKLMGIFSSEAQTASAIRGLRNTEYKLERVHSPIPSHILDDAMQLPKSKVGWFTLVGGVVGFFSGFLFAIFTATRWHLMVSGKPVIALVPFFIVGFEATILFAVFGNVIGLITQAQLPRFSVYKEYDPRFSGDRFGVLASCTASRQAGLYQFLEAKGAEIKMYATNTGPIDGNVDAPAGT